MSAPSPWAFLRRSPERFDPVHHSRRRSTGLTQHGVAATGGLYPPGEDWLSVPLAVDVSRDVPGVSLVDDARRPVVVVGRYVSVSRARFEQALDIRERAAAG